jgi:SAM-dependent methyltransferase
MKECTATNWEHNTKTLNWDRVRLHDKLVSVIQETLTSGSVLEVGAQSGLDAEYLADKGFQVKTVDYNPEAIRLLHQRRGLEVVMADGLSLPFSDESFDLVYSQGLIEHFRKPDLGLLVDEQKRVTKTDGYVLIDVPNTFSLNTIPKQVLIAMGKWIVPWETQYTARQLRTLGEQHGLEFVKLYSWGYDKFIGERMERILSRYFGESFRRFEDNYGHYFKKCIGLLFQKPTPSR